MVTLGVVLGLEALIMLIGGIRLTIKRANLQSTVADKTVARERP
jgi:glucose uptake protein GlcU